MNDDIAYYSTGDALLIRGSLVSSFVLTVLVPEYARP